MYERITGLEGAVARIAPNADFQDAFDRARDEGLMLRATTLAIESALSFGVDLPVGAVVAQRNMIVGRYFASDKRNNISVQHAERMAVLETWLDPLHAKPDTIGVTIEPCDDCQDFLATQPSIKRVVFGISRNEVADRGLVKPHTEDIFDRKERLQLPFEVIKLENQRLLQIGGIILDFTTRELYSGIVNVDTTGLIEALEKLQKAA